MATVKVISSKASIGRAINYVTQEKKTNQQLISGFNLNPLLAAEQMQITKTAGHTSTSSYHITRMRISLRRKLTHWHVSLPQRLGCSRASKS